jgi:hypothetical protein
MASEPKKRHGLSHQEIRAIFDAQGGKCALSGVALELRGDAGVEEVYDPTTGKRIAIDHDHETGLIRGLLIQKVNWLVDQWEQGSYGALSKPAELTAYQQNPPAFGVIGQRTFE